MLISLEVRRLALTIFLLLVSQDAECRAMPPYVLFSEHESKMKNRTPSPPYITGDAFRAHCDYILDESNPELSVEEIGDRSTIFVGTHFLGVFFENYHSQIQGTYILVTHNSDESAPGIFADFLNDTKLIAWFSQNVEGITHPKLFPIPIGLENRYCPNGEDFSTLGAMIQEYKNDKRERLLYMNFTPRARSDRDYVFNIFQNQPYCKISSYVSYIEYLRHLGSSKFVLSPRGNGLDCLRTWESLYMGSIPIVKKSFCDEMYDDLPVLLIDSWNEISEEFLLRTFNEMKHKDYNFYKLDINYWLEFINTAKNSGRAPNKRQ